METQDVLMRRTSSNFIGPDSGLKTHELYLLYVFTIRMSSCIYVWLMSLQRGIAEPATEHTSPQTQKSTPESREGCVSTGAWD
ncbi:hypothetical protein FQN60_006431 [Etheostoma spectabile]|uniref:Uncharacterized protein n=1 Tax=Etheostoma spectabile TaxID=54343 RepID=A0A5J5CQV3_9PERO|nr:hypothetical protein FQN60_006431 [Etheostoma spectabile]